MVCVMELFYTWCVVKLGMHDHICARNPSGNWILKDPNRSKCAGNINDAIILNQAMVEEYTVTGRERLIRTRLIRSST